jgi:hypothetical protein
LSFPNEEKTSTTTTITKTAKTEYPINELIAKRWSARAFSTRHVTYSDNRNYNRLHFHDLGAANENMFLEPLIKVLLCTKWADLMYRKPERYSIYLRITKQEL